MPSLQFLVRQSEFIRALFCVQIALRNLTAITQESSAKFFAAISGCNYRNDLKLTHREFFLHKADGVGSEASSGSDCGTCAFNLTAAIINQQIPSLQDFLFFFLCFVLSLHFTHTVSTVTLLIVIHTPFR